MALRSLLITFVLLSSLTRSIPRSATGTPSPYENTDAYDVYDAILSTYAASAISPLVISAVTEPSAMCLEPEGKWKPVLMPAIADYNEKNEKTYRLQPKFRMKQQYELLTKQEINARFTHPGEGGWVVLSAVGFNRQRTIAILWVSNECPGLCGGGTFHVLHKVEGKWKPLEWQGTSCAVAS